MKNIILLILLISTLSCAQNKETVLGETDWQKEINADYKDATKSPLKKKDLKTFRSLDFFKLDSTFVVTAKFTRTENEQSFKMKTTTDRLPVYVKYGELNFKLKNKNYKLNIYQNQDLIKKEGYENYLFLPFLDDTNGEESYAGGRYIDMRIPEGDTIVINFNEAYNPYCAYNERYSCPIVPRENYVSEAINAGVKVFKKH